MTKGLQHRRSSTSVSRFFTQAATAALAGTLLLSASITALAQDPQPPTFSVLYSFTGGADGSIPGNSGGSMSLALDGEGNLYGTTFQGGEMSNPTGWCENGGCGVVFKLDRTGKETVLYSFTGGADGAAPFGLIRSSDGTLFGVATRGGSFGPSTPGGTQGNGVVFKLDTKGKFSVLYTFTGGTDGAIPYGTPLLLGGELYGTTFAGGNETTVISGTFGSGVVYKVDATGKETVLYTFTGYEDGDDPYGGLTADAEGNLYGTTGLGGDLTSPVCPGGYGCGVVFKLALHDRCNDSAKEVESLSSLNH